MKQNHLNKHFFVILLVDFLLVTSSLVLAYLIRYEFHIPLSTWMTILWVWPFALVLKLLCFYFFDLYRGMWRYTSVADLFNIIKASTASTLLIISFILFSPARFIGFSRSAFLIDWCLTILLVSGFRMVIRFYYEHQSNGRSTIGTVLKLFRQLQRNNPNALRLLIIGAGDAGEKIFREIRDNASLQYQVIGFVDDHPSKVGMKIHGMPVLGFVEDIKAIAEKTKADEALIAIPSATSPQMRRIVHLCDQSGVPFKTIPGLGELIGGKVTANAIREVAYRDLLGREVVQLDEEGISAYIQDRSILVTGAGGSIGSELCRQICRFKPAKLVLYERAESSLYHIDLELKDTFADIEFIPVLGDTQNMRQLLMTFDTHRPQTAFHAAAYKHVPMLEIQPWKAIENNIMTTANILKAVNRYQVGRFVFVSTDKAVRPVNVMGASKRVAEMLIQSQNHDSESRTRFAIVRFGNVVGSVGSVVPLFKKQIAQGGPVTVTHPEMTRFFMTISEAGQLILQAGALSTENTVEVFILDMGTPVKIVDMARDLIRLSGFEPDVDIKIEYTGVRPGEKLYEELITEGEGIVPTNHEKIMALRGESCNPTDLRSVVEELVLMAGNQEKEGIRAKLMEIVSDYRPTEDWLKYSKADSQMIETDG